MYLCRMAAAGHIGRRCCGPVVRAARGRGGGRVDAAAEEEADEDLVVEAEVGLERGEEVAAAIEEVGRVASGKVLRPHGRAAQDEHPHDGEVVLVALEGLLHRGPPFAVRHREVVWRHLIRELLHEGEAVPCRPVAPPGAPNAYFYTEILNIQTPWSNQAKPYLLST